MNTRHIFAIADNGFRTDKETLSLYQMILKTSGKMRPKVCVIPTASGDDQSYLDAFYAMFSNYDCDVSHVSLFRGETEAIENHILAQDVIYVTGGNTRNMLVLWKEWGVSEMLRKAYQDKGVVLAGGSAGSLCWFESGVTDSIPGRFSSMNCLGFLKGSNCPHYNEFTRRPFYLNAVQSGELQSGFGAQNGVALHFENEIFKEALSAYPNRFAYRLERADQTCREIEIPARVLS